VAAALASGLLVCGLVSTASAGTGKRGPKIAWAEFGNDPSNSANYQFRAGAIRATSVGVQLRESPAEGQTTGPTETVNLSKTDGSSSPEVWTGTTSRTRPAPCYRAAFVAKSSHGKSVRAYRMCAFGSGPPMRRWKRF
jgi:hypothetical protein